MKSDRQQDKSRKRCVAFLGHSRVPYYKAPNKLDPLPPPYGRGKADFEALAAAADGAN